MGNVFSNDEEGEQQVQPKQQKQPPPRVRFAFAEENLDFPIETTTNMEQTLGTVFDEVCKKNQKDPNNFFLVDLWGKLADLSKPISNSGTDFLVETKVIPSYKFNKEENIWKPHFSSENPCPKSFSIISYNVWFDELKQSERFSSLLFLLREKNVDVVGFQEMKKETVAQLLKDDFVRENYSVSDSEKCSSFGSSNYGVFFLTKFHPKNFVVTPIPSKYGRRLISFSVPSDAGNFIGFSVGHFDSGGGPQQHTTRLTQYVLASQIHKDCSHSVIMGDFNYDFESDEGKRILANELSEFQDSGGKFSVGTTYGVPMISMRKDYKGEQVKERIDMILLRSSDLEFSDSKVLGNSPISENPNLFISDHAGLIAKIDTKVKS